MGETRVIDYENDRIWVADLEDRAYIFAYRLLEKDSNISQGRALGIVANAMNITTEESVWGLVCYLEGIGNETLKTTINEIHLNIPPRFPRQVDANTLIACPERLNADEIAELKPALRRLDSGILVYDD
jgi:hypothetical protein